MDKAEIIENLRALPKRSSRQNKLIAFADKAAPTPAEAEILEALFEFERTHAAARTASVDASKKLAKHSGSERRTKKSTLVKRGELIAIAGAQDFSDEQILGALLEMKRAPLEDLDAWKNTGTQVLAAHSKNKAS